MYAICLCDLLMWQVTAMHYALDGLYQGSTGSVAFFQVPVVPVPAGVTVSHSTVLELLLAAGVSGACRRRLATCSPTIIGRTPRTGQRCEPPVPSCHILALHPMAAANKSWERRCTALYAFCLRHLRTNTDP